MYSVLVLQFYNLRFVRHVTNGWPHIWLHWNMQTTKWHFTRNSWLQWSTVFIYFGIMNVKDVFYLFHTCGYLELDCLFPVTSEQKYYLWSLVFHASITENVIYSLFIMNKIWLPVVKYGTRLYLTGLGSSSWNIIKQSEAEWPVMIHMFELHNFIWF